MKMIVMKVIIFMGFCSNKIFSMNEGSSCVFKKMGGTLPDKVCYIREFLKKTKSILESEKNNIQKIDNKSSSEKVEYRNFCNAYIFYGISGLGKSKTTILIADEAGVLLEFHNQSDITRKIQVGGNPDEVIAKIYEDAEAKSKKNKIPVIVVIDEIDTLFKKNPELVDTIFGAFRCRLDKYREDPNIVTIFTSNTVKRLDYAFLRRCIQIEWTKPSLKDREEIIKLYLKNYGNIQVSSSFIKSIGEQTQDFTGADLEYVFINADSNGPMSEISIKQGVEEMRKAIESRKLSYIEQALDFVKEHSTTTTTIGAVVILAAYKIIEKITGKKLPKPKK